MAERPTSVRLTANDVLRFALELVGIASVAYWGFNLPDDPVVGITVAVIAVGAFVVVWGVVAAPRARNRLSQDARFLIGSGVLLVGALALSMAGASTAAFVFALAVVANTAIRFAGRRLGRDGP